MDKQKALREIVESIKHQKEELENIEFKIEEAKHQAAVRESFLDGQRKATKISIGALYELRAGLEAIE